MNWDNEKEEKRLIWYLLGFDDGEIGALSEPVVSKSNVCSWRGRRELPRNHGFSDRKWYPLNNSSHKILSDGRGHPLSAEREEFLISLYNEGLNDTEIAKKVNRERTTIRGWRLKRRLSPNAMRGRQPVEEGGCKVQKKTRKARKKQIKGKFKQKPKKRATAKERKMGVRQLREKIAREKEEEIIASLPSKEEVYQKVRNSPRGQVTTAQLIKQGYGDVGDESRDTVGKLRALADEDGLLELNTDEKGKILWIA